MVCPVTRPLRASRRKRNIIIICYIVRCSAVVVSQGVYKTPLGILPQPSKTVTAVTEEFFEIFLRGEKCASSFVVYAVFARIKIEKSIVGGKCVVYR